MRLPSSVKALLPLAGGIALACWAWTVLTPIDGPQIADRVFHDDSSHPLAPASERDREKRRSRLAAKLTRLADHGPKRPDQPQEAMDFFLRQRLLPGHSVLPLESLRQAYALVAAREAAQAANPAGGPTLPVWTELGPSNLGGRTRSIVINPANPSIMYAGSVAGGVWRSINGGLTWSAADDLMLNLSISSLVISPDNPNVLYAGTGEGMFNSDAVRGLGIFKTVDGGTTWTQLAGTVVGVPAGAFYRVNELAISPANSNVVYACTRFGVFKSNDAGANWTALLRNPDYVVDPTAPATNGCSIGCSDLALRRDTAPGQDVIVAAFGSFEPDGLFRSMDGGDTWVQLGTSGDLRVARQGRMEIAVAPSDNDVIYVSMADNGDTGSALGTMVDVFRTVDGGDSWSPRLDYSYPTSAVLLSNPAYGNGCWGSSNFAQGWYDNVIVVDPHDADIVWVGGVDLFRSDDGGRRFGIASYWFFDRGDPNYVHADHHALVFHPQYNGTTNQILYSGSDGGIARTDSARAATSLEGCPLPPSQPLPAVQWTQVNEGYGTIQFYHGDSAKDREAFGGGTQDNGTLLVESATTPDGWREILGGDGGYFFIDPFNSQTMYAETQKFPNILKSTDGGQTWSPAVSGISDTDGLFITPFTLDQRLPTGLWTGGSKPWRTTDGAASWVAVGPNFIGPATLSAVTVAPSDSAVVYLGFNNGYVARTTNGLPGIPTWTVFGNQNGVQVGGFVSSIAVDPTDPDVAYCTYSSFNVNHILRTTNGGSTWVPIDGPAATGLPDIPVHCLAIRPCNTHELYAGTELGVFMSPDGGGSWLPSNSGLAHTVVEYLDFEDADTLVAFTHGRGTFRAALTPFCDGACCVAGTCAGIMTDAACDSLGGQWFVAESCDDVACSGACCDDSNGACVPGVTASECAQSGGTRFLEGASCAGFDPVCGGRACCRVDNGGTPGDPSDDVVRCRDELPGVCASTGGRPADEEHCTDPEYVCPHAACINAGGACTTPHAGAGCRDPFCCAMVCDQDVACCRDEWDQICVDLAARACRLNDDCAAAQEISDGLTAFSTVGATTDGPADCLTDDPDVGTNDIWFAYEATCSGDLLVSLCGTSYDNTLQVYAGLSCVPLGTQLGCGDDTCGQTSGPAQLVVPVAEGRDYLLRVGGWGGDTGTGAIDVSCGPQIPAALEPEPNGVGRSRTIAFKSPEAGTAGNTAVRVIVRRMYVDWSEDPAGGCPPRTTQSDLTQFEDLVRWLGPPVEVSERTRPPLPNALAAPLGCCPYYRAWDAAALAAEFGPDANAAIINVYGAEIVPCSVYELQVVDFSCARLLDEGCFSDVFVVETGKWGDVWEPLGGVEQPSFIDIGKLVEKFKGIPYHAGPPPSGAPPQARAMMRGNSPPLTQAVSFLDIGSVVNAFKRMPYPEAGPDVAACSEPCGDADAR